MKVTNQLVETITRNVVKSIIKESEEKGNKLIELFNTDKNIAAELRLSKKSYQSYSKRKTTDADDRLLKLKIDTLASKLAEYTIKKYMDYGIGKAYPKSDGKELVNYIKTKLVEGVQNNKRTLVNEGKEKTFMGIPGTKYYYHGDWGTAEILYNGRLYYESDIEDYMYADYCSEMEANEEEPTDDGYSKWAKTEEGIYAFESAVDYLDEEGKYEEFD